jgi:hypothetical protein
MNTTDLIEQFADGEPVAPDALVAALATEDGREHLRGVLALRALMSEAPARGLSPSRRGLSPERDLSPWDRPLPLRIAAAALIAVTAAAGGYLAGNRRADATPPVEAAQHIEQLTAPPAPTTVIKLDATHGWRDQSGGF